MCTRIFNNRTAIMVKKLVGEVLEFDEGLIGDLYEQIKTGLKAYSDGNVDRDKMSGQIKGLTSVNGYIALPAVMAIAKAQATTLKPKEKGESLADALKALRKTLTISHGFPTTSRNMDWRAPFMTSIYVNERGVKRQGISGAQIKTFMDDNCDKKLDPLKWTSKYRSVTSVVIVEQDEHVIKTAATCDGINEKGLVVNALYDSWSHYGETDPARKQLSVFRWNQYILDMFESVDDVVSGFDQKIQLLGDELPGPGGSKSAALLHLSISDASGNSVIIEADAGYNKDNQLEQCRYTYYEGPHTTVLTNQPNYNVQQKIAETSSWQWSKMNQVPSFSLPGGAFPADRFQRALGYYHTVLAPNSKDQSVAQTRSIANSVVMPIYAAPGGMLTPMELMGAYKSSYDDSVPNLPENISELPDYLGKINQAAMASNETAHPMALVSTTWWTSISENIPFEENARYFFLNMATMNNCWIQTGSLPFDDKNASETYSVSMVDNIDGMSDFTLAEVVNNQTQGCLNGELIPVATLFLPEGPA